MNYKDIKVALFLVFRYIRGASIWQTSLIIFVMVLTFLNLTVIGGILEGIIVGSLDGLREKALGDVVITPKENSPYIERTQQILFALDGDSLVSSYSARHSISVEIITEDDFRKVTNNKERRRTASSFAFAVDPEAEDKTTRLSESLVEGTYFSELGKKEALIGSGLIKRYSQFGEDVLSNIYPGDFIYIRIGPASSQLQKYLVRGIFKTKAGELDFGIVINESEGRLYSGAPGNNVNTIAIRTVNTTDGPALKENLIAAGFGKYALIETIDEAVGKFLDDIRRVFSLLGTVVGSIGLIVSSITIFIIIFVTAYSKRKFIGILKAIGITPSAIKFSYVLFSLFFATVGIIIGSAILFFILVPYFNANPIQFPFSDGILFITTKKILIQISLLFVATYIAGIIPAHRVVSRPAIESVRGR